VILVCGETLADLVPTGADAFRALPGGSPANVAVGIARLGEPAAMLARISRDRLGSLLRRHLADNGVDLRHVVAADEPATLAVVSLDEAGRASYSFYANGTADWQWKPRELPAHLDDVSAVHFGSLAMTLAPGAEILETFMQRVRDRHLVSYDPNVRPALEDPAAMVQRVQRQVGLAHVVRASTDDLSALYPGCAVDDVARSWLDRGPHLVVVTDGPDGAHGFTVHDHVHVAARHVSVADTVGAGDAFMSALLVGLARRSSGPPDTETLRVLLHDAADAASWTCMRAGADPPRRDELTQWRADGMPD